MNTFVLAFRNIVRQRRRSLLSLAAVSFGVIALLLAGGFIQWIFWAMREDTVGSRLGHIQISRLGYQVSGTADPFHYLLPAQSPELAAIENTPGVVTVAPRLGFSGLVSHGEATVSFVGEGVDPQREAFLSRSVIITQGTNLLPGDQNGIVMGRGLAANLGVHVGDQVVLLTNLPSGGVRAVEGHVLGLFSTIVKAYDDSALRVPLPLAQKLMGVSGSHVWVTLLQRTDDTEKIMGQLRGKLDRTKFELVPWTQLADFYNKTVVLFSRQFGVVRIIIGAIIILGISNTMMMNVMERTGEIGTIMAMGTRRRQLITMFLSEGLLLGIFGALIGLVLGLGLAMLISAIGIPMPPPPGMDRALIGQIRITPTLAFESLLLAVATTLIASVYPAWKASRLTIVDALRHNR